MDSSNLFSCGTYTDRCFANKSFRTRHRRERTVVGKSGQGNSQFLNVIGDFHLFSKELQNRTHGAVGLHYCCVCGVQRWATSVRCPEVCVCVCAYVCECACVCMCACSRVIIVNTYHGSSRQIPGRVCSVCTV